MPVSDVIDTKIVENDASDAFAGVMDRVRKHLVTARVVRARRKRTGRKRYPPLRPAVGVAFDPAKEDADELVDEIVGKLQDAIADDADGRAWKGEILIYDDVGKVLDTIEVAFEPDEPAEKPTRESENVAWMASARHHHEGMAKQVRELAASLASIGVAFKDVIQSVAGANAEVRRAELEYEWKTQESRERMDTNRVDQEAAVLKRKHLLDAGKEVLVEYAPLAELLAQWAVSKAPSIPPTHDEIDRFFPSERYSALRRDLHALVSDDVDDDERKPLVRALIKTIKALGANAFGEAREALSDPRDVQRFGEIVGWISRPVKPSVQA